MQTRKCQIIKSLCRKYRVFKFNGLGQCTLTRGGKAALGEPRIVEVTAPASIGCILMNPDLYAYGP